MPSALSKTFKLLALTVGIVLLAAAGLFWWLTTRPLNSTTLTPYIESVFERIVPDTTAKIGQSSFDWDHTNLTLTLTCEDVQLRAPSGAVVLSFPKAGLKLSAASYLRGRVLPEEFTATGAQFHLVRDAHGALSFGIVPETQELEPKPHAAVDVFAFLQNIADEVSNSRLRHTIEIKDIVLTIDDVKTKQKAKISVPEISLHHKLEETKAKASVKLSENDQTAALQLSYGFDYKTSLHEVALAFQQVRLSSFAAFAPRLSVLQGAEFPSTGALSVKTDRDLDIVAAKARIDGGAGALTYPDLWDKPRGLQRFALEALYDRKKESLEIPLAEVDFGGPKLAITASAKTPVPTDLLWLSRKKENNSFTVKVTLDNVPMDQYGAIWPKTIIPDARNWIEKSLSKGIFTHGEVEVKGRVRLDDIENLTLEGGGGFIDAKGARVLYLDGMPVIDDASAHATFDLDHMDVEILSGHTGAVKVEPFTLVMDNFQQDIQNITIPAKLTGPIGEVLKILDAPPLGYAKEIGLDPADSVGEVSGTLTLRMPMLDALLLKDVEVKADARLKGFGAKKLIPGIELSRGDMALDVSKDGFGLKGGIALNTVPAQIVWKSRFKAKDGEPLHEASVQAAPKNEQWDLFYTLGKLVKVQGETPVTLEYKNLRKGLSQLSGAVALKSAAVQVKDIAWSKPAGAVAKLAFALDIEEGKNLVFRTIDLSGQGVKVAGSAELDEKTSELVGLDFDPFIVGRSNARVHYTAPVEGSEPITIKIEGEAFDSSGFEDEDQSKKDAPLVPRSKDYFLKVTKLHTSEKGFMGSLSGHARRDAEGWREIDLWGVAQGSVPVEIKLGQKAGRAQFKVASDNFGLAMQGLGLSDGIKGGSLEIIGEGTKSVPRAIEGKIKIGAFTLVDMPVFARLLSAVSPFSYIDLITGEASFDHLRGDFRWYRDQVDLRDVRAAGSVVGINLDGRLDLGSDQANMNGTLVPFSMMNSILGSIPLLGDVITGGSGQGIIAAAFTVKGSLGNPDISVNPVSLLTPGFLRNLFFDSDEPPKVESK